MKKSKVQCEVRRSEDCITALMRVVFRREYKSHHQAKFRVPYKSYHVYYIIRVSKIFWCVELMNFM